MYADASKNTILTFVLALTLILILGVSSARCELSGYAIHPQFGYSQPVSSQADKWLGGYSLALTGFQENNRPFQFGIGLYFQRWLPNTKEMLKIDDYEVKIEREKGWKAMGDVFALAKYDIPQMQGDFLSLSVQGGVGVGYVRSSAVELKGFTTIGTTAINREISIDPKNEVVPAVLIGMNFNISDRVQPSIGYKHVFTSGDALGLFTASLGLFPR